MDLALTFEQAAFCDAADGFAKERIAPGAEERESAHKIPDALMQEVAKHSLIGINIPKSLGGGERGVVTYAHAVRSLGAADASVAVTMAVTNMVAEVINQFGTDEQKKKYVTGLCSGELVAGAFALSEQSAGSDAAALTTKAERRGDKWVLNGEKMWISHGDQSGVIVVWARTGAPGARGISCFLVEKGTKGLSPGKPEGKMGLRASHTVALTLDDVAVDESALLGSEGEGFRIAMVALDGGRIGVASQTVGIASRALERARDAALQQKNSEQQAVQFRLADAATELDAGWLLTLRAAYLKENKRRFTREAAMAKAYATEAANRAVRTAVDVAAHGGQLRDQHLGRALRDCRVTQIYEGTSEVQRIVIARDLLKSGVLS